MLLSKRILPPLTVVAALSVSMGLMFWLRPREPGAWVRMVPSDVLSLAILEGFPESVQLLTREIVPKLLSDEAAAEVGAQLDMVSAIQGGLRGLDLKAAGLLVHSLERRDPSTYKVHFSAILEPASVPPGVLEQELEAVLARWLGFAVESPDKGTASVRVYRGREPRHVLYVACIDRFLVISNGPTRDPELRRAWDGVIPRLQDRPSFQAIVGHLPRKPGVLVYWDGRQVLPFLPELGWVFWLEGGEVRDAFYAYQP